MLDDFFKSISGHPFYGISGVHKSLGELHKAFLETTEAMNQMLYLNNPFLKEQMSTYASENSIKMNSREKYKNKILDVYKKVSGK